jgi:release factor glutamine methyltransferase
VAALGEIFQELNEGFSLLPHIANPREKAALTLDLTGGYSREDIVLNRDAPIAPELEARLRDILQSARQGVPLAYAIGEWYFAGRRFLVSRDVLIPRPDTETLLITVLMHAHAMQDTPEVLEIGVGSGAVIISIACELAARKPRCVGIDVSPEAVDVARRNAELHSVNVELRLGDLFEPIKGDERFSVIISNPPYIPGDEDVETSVRDYEPESAYRVPAGMPGTHFHNLIAEGARAHLQAGGMLAMEAGFGQAGEVEAVLNALGYQDIRRVADLSGVERVVRGIWRG